MNLSKLITHPNHFVQPVSRQQLEEDGAESELILENYVSNLPMNAAILILLALLRSAAHAPRDN